MPGRLRQNHENGRTLRVMVGLGATPWGMNLWPAIFWMNNSNSASIRRSLTPAEPIRNPTYPLK